MATLAVEVCNAIPRGSVHRRDQGTKGCSILHRAAWQHFQERTPQAARATLSEHCTEVTPSVVSRWGGSSLSITPIRASERNTDLGGQIASTNSNHEQTRPVDLGPKHFVPRLIRPANNWHVQYFVRRLFKTDWRVESWGDGICWLSFGRVCTDHTTVEMKTYHH